MKMIAKLIIIIIIINDLFSKVIRNKIVRY